MPTPHAAPLQSGQHFGRLTTVRRVADHVYPSGQTAIRWEVRCSCGNVLTAFAARLHNGQCQSCGCIKREKTAARNRAGRLDVLGYSSRHARRSQSDPASAYDCVDCGAPARDWSYVGGCPDELLDRGRRYCMHDEHQVPRCKSCHNRVDGIVKNLQGTS